MAQETKANKQVSISDFLIDASELHETMELNFPQFKAPWKIQALTSDEFNALSKRARIKQRSKSGLLVNQTDDDRLADLLIEESVIVPDLNDNTLQEHYNTIGSAADTARAMLKTGQLVQLNNAIAEINGLNDELPMDDLVAEVKK
jgi:mevalonate kinase